MSTTKPTEQDFRQFEAVLGAAIKGVPLARRDQAMTALLCNIADQEVG